jgi:hypothetical protein
VEVGIDLAGQGRAGDAGPLMGSCVPAHVGERVELGPVMVGVTV